MISLNDQLELFKLIGRILKDKIECLVIGGSAMMFYGAKEATKDIDLVLMKESDFDTTREVIRELGFEERTVIKKFKHLEIKKYEPAWMEGKNTRIDLFCKGVINIKISEAMLERVKEIHEFHNLTIKVISPEDILFLKSAIERPRDKEDAMQLINKFNINWDIIIKESIKQTEIGHYLFAVFLFDFLEELKEDHKADIPKEVIKKVRKIAEEQMIKKLKK